MLVDERSLRLTGIGTEVPTDRRRVADLVREAGGDPSEHRGWELTCRARDDEHPSDLATSALRKALAMAGISADELSLVIYTGGSRDYLPSWSVAVEVCRNVGVAQSCVAFDLTLGCLGPLLGMETARSWMAASGLSHVAVVAAEKWSYTIDRSSHSSRALWAHSDGGGAMVFSMSHPRVLAEYRGACFVQNGELNNAVRIKYGGTRHPVPPAGDLPFLREVNLPPGEDVAQIYAQEYAAAFDALRQRYDVSADWLFCNQASPKIVDGLASIVGIDPGHVVRTGPEYGHLGTVDTILCLETLVNRSARGNIFVGGSSPYARGAGLIYAA